MMSLDKADIALHPRQHLTAGQIALFRHATYWQMTRTARGDWIGGGRRTRGKTMKPLITMNLLIEDYRNGRVSLTPTTIGKLALDTLNGK